MPVEKLAFDDYNNTAKVMAVLNNTEVKNVHKRASIMLGQMETAFKQKYDLGSMLKSYDGDAHDFSWEVFKVWKTELTGTEINNPIEQANAEILDTYRETTNRQNWLGKLTSVIGFQLGVVRKNKPEDQAVVQKLAQKIVEAFGKAKTEVEAKRKDKPKPNENLENDNAPAELKEDIKIRKEAKSVSADDFFNHVENQDQLGLLAEKKTIQTPDFLKQLFNEMGIKFDESYDYFSANVKLSDPQMQGLMGAYYMTRDRAVVFPAHIVSYFEELDIPADQYTALKKGIVYNELMHKILFRHYVLGDNPVIDFSESSYKDDPFLKELGEAMQSGQLGLISLKIKTQLEARGYEKGEIDEFIRFVQEFELLSDFASLSATKYELERIQGNDVLQKYLWRNPFAGYDKTNQFMEGLIDDIKSNRYFEGKDYEEIISAKELTLEEYKIVVEAYEKKSKEILARWNKMFSQKEDYIVTKIFRTKTNVPVKPDNNEIIVPPVSDPELSAPPSPTVTLLDQVSGRFRCRLNFATDSDANRYAIGCTDASGRATTFYYPKKNVGTSDSLPIEASPIIKLSPGISTVIITPQHVDGTTVRVGEGRIITIDTKSSNQPEINTDLPSNVVTAPPITNGAKNAFQPQGTTMKELYPGIKDTDAKGCVSFVNRADQLLNKKGDRFWLPSAWDMARQVKIFGGEAKYNVFDRETIPSFTSVEQSRKYITGLIKKNKSAIQSSVYNVGDLVSFYYPISGSQQDAHEQGMTYDPPVLSTHAGVVTETNGELYVTHNMYGILYSEKLSVFTHGDGGRGKCQLTGLYDVQTNKSSIEEAIQAIELLPSGRGFDYVDGKNYILRFQSVPPGINYVRVNGKPGTKYAESSFRMTRVPGTNTFTTDREPWVLRDQGQIGLWMPEQAVLGFEKKRGIVIASKGFAINNKPDPDQDPIHDWHEIS